MPFLLLFPCILPVLSGLCIFFVRSKTGRRWILLTTLLLTFGTAVFLMVTPPEPITLATVGAFSITFFYDELSRLMMPMISLLFLLVGIFSSGYMRHEQKEEQFFAFYLLTLAALMAQTIASNLLTLYACYEIMTLCSVPLVLHTRSKEAISAAIKYLGYSVFGAGCFLFGLFFLSHWGIGTFTAGGGSSAFATVNHGLALLVYLFMAIGFGCKAGLFPLQNWLPDAHPVAPSPASAVLSGVITKAGVLGIIRLTYYIYGPAFLEGSFAITILQTLSLITIFIGSMLALREPIFKRRLAYSSISQVSYVLFGIFLLSPTGLFGVLLQLVYHAVTKNLLFLVAGAIIYYTGRTRVDSLSGIGRALPFTMVFFAFGSLSLIGIPPFAGFVSKWFLASDTLAHGITFGNVFAVVMLLISALLTAGYLLPIIIRAFFPLHEKPRDMKRQSTALSMKVPMAILALLCLVLGLWPGLITPFVDPIIAAIF